MSKNLGEVRRQVIDNDPPIEVNQFWIVRNEEGDILRRLRILAKHPDGGWIYEDQPARMLVGKNLGICPELNLRYVFDLEVE